MESENEAVRVERVEEDEIEGVRVREPPLGEKDIDAEGVRVQVSTNETVGVVD